MDQQSRSSSDGPSSAPLQPALSPTKSWFPTLTAAQWITFGILAAVLSVTNIYTTLLTGWGDTGSIIAVLASVAILSAFSQRFNVESLNLGQTMVSAGGSVGFSVVMYAAVKMTFPDYEPNPAALIAMFVGMGLIGTIIGSGVRKQMVRYYFPSGTACAVIQKTVTADKTTPEARRPVRLLLLWSSLAALITLPLKLTLKKGGAAIVSQIPLGAKPFAVALDPLFYGIGIVVGPRVGFGILLGGMAFPLLIEPMLTSSTVPAAAFSTWKIWIAIAVLTIPTFATILFAYLFREPPNVPAGFQPGTVAHGPPTRRDSVYTTIALVGAALTLVSATVLFDLPFWLGIIVIVVSLPLCVMNGRVTGDTDINPVRLVTIVILSVFVFFVADGDNKGLILLGMAIVGATLAGMAVDMLQDYRTGFLLNANHHHQTSVQLVGVVIGALVAVPFILMLDATTGFGANTPLPAPGPQIYKGMVESFTTKGSVITSSLIWTVIAVSIAGIGYAFFTVWPKTKNWMPSIFGAGIGLLLPFSFCAAIFLGGMIKLVVSLVYTRGQDDANRAESANQANNDTMLVGASIFAAAAVMSVFLLLFTKLLEVVGIDFIHFAH